MRKTLTIRVIEEDGQDANITFDFEPPAKNDEDSARSGIAAAVMLAVKEMSDGNLSVKKGFGSWLTASVTPGTANENSTAQPPVPEANERKWAGDEGDEAP